MDLTNPARSVIPTLDAEVLVALAAISMPLTGRQISRLLESRSSSGVQKVLERLNEQGLVDVLPAGNANLYSLNRDHVAAPAIEALRDLRGKLFERMAKAVEEWRILPESVAVFGSAARGDGGVESDIDILVVRPAELYYKHLTDMHQVEEEPLEGFSNVWSSQLFDFGRQVFRWSGNQASLIEVTRLQLEQMVERGESVAESLRKEARYIWGQNIMKKVDSKG
jgi:predicted nucleotidyltransferase